MPVLVASAPFLCYEAGKIIITQMDPNIAIVIPTYNEKENIGKLITYLAQHYPTARIYVVDDNSPDGTAKEVQRLAAGDPNIRLLRREKKLGLASAYMDAFARIIPDESIQFIATMDADFSHDPRALKKLLTSSFAGADVAVGSRYTAGGKIENWELPRRILSRFANWYARAVTSVPIRDLTSGFVVYSREILGKSLMRGIRSEGYAYQIEIKCLVYHLGASIAEVPITFRERRKGKSKLSRGVVWEGVIAPWKIRFRKQM